MAEVAVVPSDIFPVVRRFLLESGLQRTLKAFQKETESAGEECTPVPKKRKRLMKRLEVLELTAACQLWLQHQESNKEEGEEVMEPPEKKNKKLAAVEVAVEAEAEVEEKPKKKKKATIDAEPQAAEQPEQIAPAAVASPVLAAKKKKNKEDKAQKPAGVPFSRVDEDKWNKTIKDSRMLDNTHKAKAKFGDSGGVSAGDTWADRASEDMLKVKGKGFRKEMQKKKRASWKGAGELDQGVNSVPFAQSSDEE